VEKLRDRRFDQPKPATTSKHAFDHLCADLSINPVKPPCPQPQAWSSDATAEAWNGELCPKVDDSVIRRRLEVA